MTFTRRRWFRFSLRALFVVVTLTCICGGILGGWAYRAQRQRQAVEAIRQFGFVQDYDMNEQDLGKMRMRRWLHRWLDDDYFRNVNRIQGGYSQPVRRMTDADLPLLAEFPRLKNVTLYETDVSTDGLKIFASFRRLENLWIGNNGRPIAGDGEGFHELAGSPSLRDLTLSHPPRPHDGLAFLHSMPKLEGFGLAEMKVDERDFQCIGSLKDLRSLYLRNILLTPSGLAFTESLTKLRWLNLWAVELSAEDFRRIGRLHELTMLSIRYAGRPAEGLGFLNGLPKLTWLDLPRMKLEDSDFQQMARLQRLIAVELDGGSFHNESLRWLKDLPEFVKLVLPESSIDDGAVDVLCEFPHLTELDIRQTKITEYGAATLRRKLKGCQIRHESLPDPYNVVW